MRSALLLNASFEPIKVIAWQRAVSMLFMGKVEVIEEYDLEIRSVSLVIKAPAVIRLLKFARLAHRKPPLSKANILARDNFECQYCSLELKTSEATLDHVLPRSRGGRTSWTNIVTCCKNCNRKKGGKTPEEARMPLKKEPVQPDWLPVLNFRMNGSIPHTWKIFLI